MNYPLIQLILARLREFYREPMAIFWVYGFPLLLAVGLGIAFLNPPQPSIVDVQGAPGDSTAEGLAQRLSDAGLVADVHPEAECRQRLRTGKTALFVVPGAEGDSLVFDNTRADSVLARYRVEAAVLHDKAGPAGWQPEPKNVTEPGSRYIDFLMPGLIGLNLMGGGLWGVGFVLVDMRVRKLLKRLLATPMPRGQFLLAILCSRLLLLMPEMVLLFLVGWLVFTVPMRGNPLTLLLVILVGATAFSGIGLLVASRTEKTESVSGLMNLVMLPQWLMSGAFFSWKNFPQVMHPFIQALPLTQVNDALREVMLEGASLADISWRLGILALWAVVTFALALRWFRWQ
jgi:ABC-type multidrug transport system permease subunit